MQKRGFTLIELLMVIAIIALLLAIVVPSLRQARRQATIVAVNSDLRQISVALAAYHLDHKKYPPTREDCNDGSLESHLYQLPKELAAGSYLPGKDRLQAMSSAMEDRFNPDRTYKYRGVGETIRDRNIIDRWSKARLWVPTGFPAESATDPESGQWFSEPDQSPVQWALFSIGPHYENRWIESMENRFPVPHQLWYQPEVKRGFVVRLRLKNGNEIGSFEGHP